MNSIISRLGGKRLLAKQITGLLPKHTTYVELFAGAGWVFFRKEKAKVEVLNDINRDLTTLFKVVKHHEQAFLECLNQTMFSRDLFDEFLAWNIEYLTDIQRAVRFYYLLKCSFGSRLEHLSLSGRVPFKMEHVRREIAKASDRLAETFIENRDYRKIIDKYDSPDTLFYIDPPYVDCEDYYGKGIYNKSDHIKLYELLNKIEGKFILSINNTQLYRDLYKDYDIIEVDTKYSIKTGVNKKVTELLIKNY